MMKKVISAKTHPSHYLLHKYWARKPHNVISSVISELTDEGDLVVDPCCGSGVVLKEAENLGRHAEGFDVNPIACLISEVLVNPPSVDDFIEHVGPLVSRLEDEYACFYQSGQRYVRYCKHEQIVRCPGCDRAVRAKNAEGRRSKACPDCGRSLRFNLEYLEDTVITGVVFADSKDECSDPVVLQDQMRLSSEPPGKIDVSPFDCDFEVNRRILAFEGMKTSSLFTCRNFEVICALELMIDDIEDERVKNAARLMVSASVAQCSRLIAARNNLSSGGPAWSIPGFWVPAEHLETNPIIHLKARYDKFLKGLSSLSLSNTNNLASVSNVPAVQGLKSLADQGKHARLIFFDPPYGDSVPYMEFSTMWNSFLRKSPSLDLDISVSDRMNKTEAWERYKRGLSEIAECISKCLLPEGRLVVTFNNNDLRAWESLLVALQRSSFVCVDSFYQIPAVVPSKAQKSVEGSYISDIYSTFRVEEGYSYSESLKAVEDRLVECANYRGGLMSASLTYRTAIEAFLVANIAAQKIQEIDLVITKLFVEEAAGLRLRRDLLTASESIFCKEAQDRASALLSDGPMKWLDFYALIAEHASSFGVPDMHEVKDALEGVVVFEGKNCSLLSKKEESTEAAYVQCQLELE